MTPYDTYLPPPPPCNIALDGDFGTSAAARVVARVASFILHVRIDKFSALLKLHRCEF